MYDTFKFLHVASAIVWLGSGVAVMSLMAQLRSAGDGPTLMGVTRQMDNLGKRLFGPAAMSTLLFGVVTVIVGDLGFSEPWIVIGIVGVAVSMGSVVFRNRMQQRLVTALDERGPQDPEVAATGRRIGMLNMLDLVLLFIVVWAMVVKPGA